MEGTSLVATPNNVATSRENPWLEFDMAQPSKNNEEQMALRFWATLDRSKLPADFTMSSGSSSNPLIGMSQKGGIGTTFKCSVWWSYNAEKFEAAGGENATIASLFPDVQPHEVVPVVVRTTYHAWESKEPVTNPTTGQIMEYEGLPVYQYESLDVGTEPVVAFIGHKCPSFIRPVTV